MENKIKYDGTVGRLYGIYISNLLLKIITLSIYSSWAKTKVRKYIYGRISIFGDRLEYSGKGGELFKGLAKVMAILIVASIMFTILVAVVMRGEAPVLELVFFYGVVITLVYFSQFSSLRYRLARSRWRGIKASLSGSAASYTLFRLKRLFLNIITLGILTGKSDLLAKEILIENTAIGSLKFRSNIDISALNKTNIVTLLLAIPTLAFSRLWYKARLKNITWESISIGNIRFETTYTGFNLFGLYMGNLLIIILTLGLGVPVVINRSVRYATDHLKIIGSEEDVKFIQSQVKQKDSAIGEGLDEVVGDGDDIGFDLGIW